MGENKSPDVSCWSLWTEMFGGNLLAAGGWTKENVWTVRFHFANFVFFFLFKNVLFFDIFQCWPFLCYFCQLKLHWGRLSQKASCRETRTCRFTLFLMLDSPASDVLVSTAERHDCTVSSSLTSGFLCFHDVKLEGTLWEVFVCYLLQGHTRREIIIWSSE